ncbi:MAG: glycosyltransferase [Elainellaceae cyanobacterium]
MQKPVLTIFYQFNPWRPSIGGIQTVILNFIKFAPSEFEVRLVGTGNRDMPAGKWYCRSLSGRQLMFFPLFNIEDDDVRHVIPTSVKYTFALAGKDLASDFMHFHRLEPALVSTAWSGHKALFIHNDVRREMSASKGNGGILWRYAPWAYFSLERFLVHRFDQVLSCNADSSQLYRELYPSVEDRIYTVRNPVDESIFYPFSSTEIQERRQNLAQRMSLAPDTRFILFAGRLHPQKDPELLVRAFAELEMPDIHLLMAGEGELKQSLNTVIDELGLQGRVTLLGAVGQDQLANLYRVASVFALSSAYEGLPVTVLEALACGCPVVTTQAGETPKILTTKSGQVAEERTPKALSIALSTILDSPQQFAQENCLQAVAPFSARNVVGEVYRDMWRQWERRMGNQEAARFSSSY